MNTVRRVWVHSVKIHGLEINRVPADKMDAPDERRFGFPDNFAARLAAVAAARNHVGMFFPKLAMDKIRPINLFYYTFYYMTSVVECYRALCLIC